MKRLLLLFFLFVLVQNTFASHFRAGEITYEYVGNAAYPYRYHITITTYTKWIDPTSIDNCELKVFFGDGDSAIAPRTNGVVTSTCAPNAEGQMIPGTTTRKNIYETEHDYFKGPGNYMITMEKAARNIFICNINPLPSDQYSFFLQSELVINPFLGNNNSPT